MGAEKGKRRRANPDSIIAQRKFFAAQLIAARGNEHFTQEQLAALVKVSLKQYQNWEAAMHIPRREPFKRLCEVLKKDSAYFTGEKLALVTAAPAGAREKILAHINDYINSVDDETLWWALGELRKRFPTAGTAALAGKLLAGAGSHVVNRGEAADSPDPPPIAEGYQPTPDAEIGSG